MQTAEITLRVYQLGIPMVPPIGYVAQALAVHGQTSLRNSPALLMYAMIMSPTQLLMIVLFMDFQSFFRVILSCGFTGSKRHPTPSWA